MVPHLPNHCYTHQNLTQDFFHFRARPLFRTIILRSPLHPHSRLQLPLASLRVSSKPSLLDFLLVPKRRISKFCAKELATLLLGSLFFLGSLTSRPVLAVPVQEIERSYQRRDGEEEVMCLKLLRENPTDIEALKMVVNVKMKSGKTNEAVEFVEMLIELQPYEMEWRLVQALCYEMVGDLAKAKSLFQNILKQKPLLLRALHGLAIVMHKNGEGHAVFDMLQKALEFAQCNNKVDEERNICILVAQMHVIKGELEEALEKFQVLIDENPRDFRPYLCQGIIYNLLDESDDAERRFEIYRSLVPEEFPQKGFLDDVLATKTKSKQWFEKELRI